MSGFPFGLGGGFGDSPRGRRHDPFESFTSDFMKGGLDEFMDDMDSDFGSNMGGSRRADSRSGRGRSMTSSYDSEGDRPSAYSGFPGMPGDDRTVRSRNDTGDYRPSAYSGFPGMPGDDKFRGTTYRDNNPDFTEPYIPGQPRRARNESVDHRPSAYSGFPGMPGDDRTAGGRSRRDDFDSTASRPFNMRRADSHSERRRDHSTVRPRQEETIRPEKPRTFRATERRPESSSRPAESSRRRADTPESSRRRADTPESSRRRADTPRAAPEASSRNQYNGAPPMGRPQETSHNAYNGPRPKAEKQRKQSPPPKPRDRGRDKPSNEKRSNSHARSESSHSRARSASSSAKPSAAAGPAPSRAELKALFNNYNAKWEALSRTSASYPLPASYRELTKLDFHGGPSTNMGKWSSEEILVANVQLIFLAGFGMSGTIKRYSDGLEVKIDNAALNGENMKLLGKWLSRKEQPRWHPDRMNLRTGREGSLDENISKKADVVAMRSAAQRLLAIVNA